MDRKDWPWVVSLGGIGMIFILYQVNFVEVLSFSCASFFILMSSIGKPLQISFWLRIEAHPQKNSAKI